MEEARRDQANAEQRLVVARQAAREAQAEAQRLVEQAQAEATEAADKAAAEAKQAQAEAEARASEAACARAEADERAKAAEQAQAAAEARARDSCAGRVVRLQRSRRPGLHHLPRRWTPAWSWDVLLHHHGAGGVRCHVVVERRAVVCTVLLYRVQYVRAVCVRDARSPGDDCDGIHFHIQ